MYVKMYVCSLYGYPRLDLANDLRKATFLKYFEGKQRIINFCFLPSCQVTLRFPSQPFPSRSFLKVALK